MKLLHPHAMPAIAGIAGIKKDNARFFERRLQGLERGCARVCNAALYVLNAHFRDAGRGSEVSLLPPDNGSGSANLCGRNHVRG